jgi:hypothetical protein
MNSTLARKMASDIQMEVLEKDIDVILSDIKTVAAQGYFSILYEKKISPYVQTVLSETYGFKIKSSSSWFKTSTEISWLT